MFEIRRFGLRPFFDTARPQMLFLPHSPHGIVGDGIRVWDGIGVRAGIRVCNRG